MYCISLITPVILIISVYIIAHSTYSYKELMDNFIDGWDAYINDEIE